MFSKDQHQVKSTCHWPLRDHRWELLNEINRWKFTSTGEGNEELKSSFISYLSNWSSQNEEGTPNHGKWETLIRPDNKGRNIQLNINYKIFFSETNQHDHHNFESNARPQSKAKASVDKQSGVFNNTALKRLINHPTLNKLEWCAICG